MFCSARAAVLTYRHTDVTVNGTPYPGARWFRITESRISYTPWTECDGRFAGNYTNVPGLKDSKLVFGSEFLRQANGTESRGGIAGEVIAKIPRPAWQRRNRPRMPTKQLVVERC